MLQRHYQLSSKMSVDSVFDAGWKEEVEESVNGNRLQQLFRGSCRCPFI